MACSRFQSLVTLLLVAFAGAGAALADEPPPPLLGFDLIFGDNPRGQLPTGLAWAPGGATLGYLWDDGEGKALWAVDVAHGGAHRLLVREGGPLELELDAYQWTPAGSGVVIESAGDLLLLPAAGELRRLTETAAEESDPKLSPDGGQVAFVREHDLWLLDLASGEERPLTTGGAEGELLNGVTDWVYWEEIWGRDSTGHWWSPDGRRIAYYQFDESPVGRYPLVDFTAVPYPEVEWQRYPKAGTANPLVRVGVIELESGATVWMETGDAAEHYLARVDWHPAGDLLIQRLDRDQTRLELLRCDPASGACAVLWRDEWPTWVNLTSGMHPFGPDGRFLAPSEKSGWRRLYLHAADGSELRPLTPEGWSVTSLDAVHWLESWFVFTAYRGGGLGAKERRVFRGSLAGGEPAPVSAAAGWSSATVSPDSGNLVLTWSGADSPATQTVLDSGGRELAQLPSTPPPYDPAALPAWRFLTLPGPDGAALPAALLEPAGRRPGRRHPVIMYHYGGPASQVVADRWDRRGRSLWHKMMAERGFAVLLVDNRGSTFFGKAGEDRLHRRFGEVNLAAQLAGLDYLAGLDWVDSERIGLWGWSGGGANTLYSILKRPGRWAAAVAGAPVTDWRLYDTIWTERYLDRPESNPDGYRDSSAATWAGELTTPLLIVHGTGDDNVHPQNTLALVHKLVEAGAPVETAIYPRQKHGFEGAASRHFYERMTEFFERQLGGRQPPASPPG